MVLRPKLPRRIQDERGQAVTEYVLVLFVVVAGFMIFGAAMRKYQLSEKLLSPLREKYAYAYRYGDEKARGYDDPGGPKKHPRIDVPSNGNYRIFYAKDK